MPERPDLDGVILVEGPSDRVAVEALAERLGRDLAANRWAVVAMGGASSFGHFLGALGPTGRGLRLAGLCDRAEVGALLQGLERAGLHDHPTSADLATLGFFVCIEDLEDELVRAVGPDRVEGVFGVHGDLRAWRTFQRQPAQRGRSPVGGIRRFLGAGSGRKVAYSRRLVEALDLAAIPGPLAAVLGTA